MAAGGFVYKPPTYGPLPQPDAGVPTSSGPGPLPSIPEERSEPRKPRLRKDESHRPPKPVPKPLPRITIPPKAPPPAAPPPSPTPTPTPAAPATPASAEAATSPALEGLFANKPRAPLPTGAVEGPGGGAIGGGTPGLAWMSPVGLRSGVGQRTLPQYDAVLAGLRRVY